MQFDVVATTFKFRSPPPRIQNPTHHYYSFHVFDAVTFDRFVCWPSRPHCDGDVDDGDA